jgi:hypothetical protein
LRTLDLKLSGGEAVDGLRHDIGYRSFAQFILDEPAGKGDH